MNGERQPRSSVYEYVVKNQPWDTVPTPMHGSLKSPKQKRIKRKKDAEDEYNLLVPK